MNFALTRDHEQKLLGIVRADGFAVLPHRVTGTNFAAAVQTNVPQDRDATPADYDWTIVASRLMDSLQGRMESEHDVPSGFLRAAEFLLGTTTVPCIEWLRTRRDLTDRLPGGRLYVNPSWDYGPLQPWLGPTVVEFERMRRLIKSWTVRRGPLYVSKELIPLFAAAGS